MLFNYFYSSMFNRLSNKYLKNWFNFIFVIEEIGISIENLSCLRLSFRIWNENGRWWSINIVVCLYLCFRNITFTITKLLPVVGPGHLLHLQILISLFLTLALSLSFLSKSTLAHLFLPLLHIGLFHSLLFDQSWVWLHIHRNYKCSKCISTNNTTIVHDVLRCHLAIR